jgi:hypothetical protein
MGVRRFDNAEDVADFVATVFLEVLKSADRFDPRRGGAVAWLYGLAGNVAGGMHRQRVRAAVAVQQLAGRAFLDADGLIFGRVGAGDATTIVITFLDNTTARTPVAEAGFFGAPIPDSAMDAMMVETPPGPKDPPTKDGGPIRGLDLSLVTAISVTATDAAGNPVAHGVTSPDWVH